MQLQSYVGDRSPSHVDQTGLTKCCISTFAAPVGLTGVLGIVLWDQVKTPPVIIFKKYAGMKVFRDFEVNATFIEAGDCCCSCCEYRQYIRGRMSGNGLPLEHDLLPGEKLDPNMFHEDGLPDGTVNGHRLDHQNRETDIYGLAKGGKDPRKYGCAYASADQPGMSGPPGTRLDYDVTFQGVIIDKCNNDERKDTREWRVRIEYTVPLHPPRNGA